MRESNTNSTDTKDIRLGDKIDTPEHPLTNPKKALIYTQILFSPIPISAKNIAFNTKLPLNTVYHHLKQLNASNIIDSKKEIVGNLVKETWYITKEFTDYQNKRNEMYSIENPSVFGRLSINPDILIQGANFIQASVSSYIHSYKENLIRFEKKQKESNNPSILKIWALNSDEYKYVLGEFSKIRENLRKMNNNRNLDEKYQNQFVTDQERFLVFLGGFPPIE